MCRNFRGTQNCKSTQGVETPCYLLDCHASFHSARNDGSEVIHIQKFVNFLNNKAVSTPCVNNSRKSTQWAEATLLSKFFTFDNLSEKNQLLRFVINNFNLIKEDIRMRISKTKKILTIILSVGLLFAISCGDRPTEVVPAMEVYQKLRELE